MSPCRSKSRGHARRQAGERCGPLPGSGAGPCPGAEGAPPPTAGPSSLAVTNDGIRPTLHSGGTLGERGGGGWRISLPRGNL